MAWNFFRRKKTGIAPKLDMAREAGGADAPPVQDTRAAIEELSRVVKNDPEAVEIYLALGSLYRSQGEIERAIQIRNSLILRPGLDARFKARAWFELGRDFRRGGFLDRASSAFAEARSLGYEPTAILLENARLAAQRSDFERAAEAYGQLGLPLPQAHYYVRLAQERFRDGADSQGARALRHAFRAYPGSPEAWLQKIEQAYFSGNRSKLASVFAEALGNVEPELCFVLMDELHRMVDRTETRRQADADEATGRECSPRDVLKAVLPAIEERDQDVLLLFYAAKILLRFDEISQARTWLEKALLLHPDFWLARLELFELSRNEQSLTPFFKEQLNFFLARAHEVRRFYCRKCGLKRDQVFFVCPRCHTWHSIAFRTDFSQ